FLTGSGSAAGPRGYGAESPGRWVGWLPQGAANPERGAPQRGPPSRGTVNRGGGRLAEPGSVLNEEAQPAGQEGPPLTDPKRRGTNRHVAAPATAPTPTAPHSPASAATG